MSQEKVDRYKQEKYNRKSITKKKKIKKKFIYTIVSLVAFAFVIYLGYSLGVSTGLIELPTEPYSMSKAEIASLRDTLIEKNDPNVQHVETTTAAAPAPDQGSNEVVTANPENTTAKASAKKASKKSTGKKAGKKTTGK